MNNKSLPACKTLVGTIATLCSALCSSMLASAGAVAQGTALEEVVVTAQMRTQSLQDVPISIIAVSGEAIDDAGITDLRDDGSNITLGETGGQNLKDETLLFAPDWSTTFNAQYVMPLSANLLLVNDLDINYKDEFYSALDLDPNTLSKPKL